MRQARGIRTIVLILTANLITLGFAHTAGASIIGTEAALEMQERAARIERIHSVLARDAVHNELIRLGVEPADAAARLARLSDSELQLLEARMDELPAGGGALEVLGVLLLVLLVLELVGVTDVFKAF